MKYLSCDSEYHFVRDCPKLTKSNLVGLVIDRVSNPDALRVYDILDVAQDLPDDVWLAISNHPNNESQSKQNDLPASSDSVLFTNLATWSEVQSDTQSYTLPSILWEMSKHTASKISFKVYNVIMKSTTSPDPTEFLKSKVMRMMSEDQNDFEG